MKMVFVIAVVAALAALWCRERFATARLHAQVEAKSGDVRAAATVLRERDRLRALQPSEAELASLRRAGTERAQLVAAVAAQNPGGPASAKLDLGEWRPASSWKDCGQATPNAAIETMLWAAAGGDVAMIKNLLSISNDTREKAEALLAQLPAAARGRYAKVEDLIAELTVKNIPVGSAQLVWFNQLSEDTATACLFLQKPAPDAPDSASQQVAPPLARDEVSAQSPTIVAEPINSVAQATTRQEALARAAKLQAEHAAHPASAAPQLTENPTSGTAYLSLVRKAEGWRLVVPPSAIASFAKQLTKSGAP